MILYLDTETKSPIPIKAGAYKYHEQSSILLISYAIDDNPVKVIDIANNESVTTEFTDALKNASEIWAHNASFDRLALCKFFKEVPKIARWRCSMALAYSLSLPGSLDALCSLFNLPTDVAKDKEGKKYIQMFCVNDCTADTHPVQWSRFKNYARLDVEAMRIIIKRMLRFPSYSKLWDEWALDLCINDRGILIDKQLVDNAISLLNSSKLNTDDTVKRLTKGVVETAGQRDRLIDFMKAEYNISLDTLTKSTVDKMLADSTLPEPAKQILIERQKGSKTSVAKYNAIAEAVNVDNRLRGTLQFMGATRTGRWSGKKFQPQNLPRGSMSPSEVELAIKSIKIGAAEYMYSDLSTVASNCLRGCIVAGEGNKLVVSDLSNIEGRVLAWLAGESWKIKAFSDFDNGVGHDLYKLAYSRSFNIAPQDVNKKQRQIGKVMELGLGYEGGVGAFCTFAAVYNMSISELAEHTLKTASPVLIKAANDWYKVAFSKNLTHGLTQDEFIACDCLKRAWRQAHPNVCNLWRFFDDNVRAIARGDITEATLGNIKVFKLWTSLFIKLPSGRLLHYPRIKLVDDKIAYEGVNSMTNKWGVLYTYGGKLTENVVQATARDILASALLPVERAGYNTVMTVHDELVTEAPDNDSFTASKLSSILASPPAWASGLPLAAAGFESKRYKKD